MAKIYTVQKGDNLTKIAQKFGYSDYTSAGVKSVPTGNFDIVRPGDQITLDNVKDDAIPQIPKAPIIASSKSLAGDFYNASSTLGQIQDNQSKTLGTNTDVNNQNNKNGIVNVNGNQNNQNNGNNGIIGNNNGNPNPNPNNNNGNSGGNNDVNGDGTTKIDDNSEYSFENDPMYKLIKSENEKEINDFNTKMESHIQEFKDAYKTDLSANSSTYASAEASANASFERSAKLLGDILQHNQSLARMNGSSGGFGEANIMATNAGMSANEMDYAHEIQNLSLTRNQLIQEAAKNRDAGNALALKNNIESIAGIEEKMTQNMQRVATEGLNKLKTLKEMSIQKQKELQEKRTATASSYAIQFADDYEKATTDEDRNKIVANIIKQSKGVLTTADVYNALNKRITDKKKAYLEELKTNAEIEKYKADANEKNYKAGEYSNVTDPSKGIIAGYNIRSYATDPNHEARINSIYSKTNATTADDFNSLIRTATPTSPITGEMILATAEKYGVDPKMIYSIILQDSSNGTKGKATSTFNPGNVGNDDAGNIRKYGSWQAGVDAVGEWLAGHRIKGASKDKAPTKKVVIKKDDGIEITLDNLPVDYQTEYEKAKTPEETQGILSKIAKWWDNRNATDTSGMSTSTKATTFRNQYNY